MVVPNSQPMADRNKEEEIDDFGLRSGQEGGHSVKSLSGHAAALSCAWDGGTWWWVLVDKTRCVSARTRTRVRMQLNLISSIKFELKKKGSHCPKRGGDR